VETQGYNTAFGQPGFSDVFFASTDTVFFSSGQYIWRSVTGGAAADTVHNFGTITGPENTLFFLNGYQGWVMRSGRLFRTTNGGSAWTAGFSAGANSVPGGLQFLSTQLGFFMLNGRLYATTDGGTTASVVYDFGGNDYIDLHFFDSQNGYASAGNRIYRTTNGGTTWTVVAALGDGFFSEIHFVDPTHGWAAGYNGAVLRFRP
jgi:photosystem II stability/assembly factor-like uncharacterized protein